MNVRFDYTDSYLDGLDTPEGRLERERIVGTEAVAEVDREIRERLKKSVMKPRSASQ